MRNLVAAFKLLLFLGWTFFLIPFQCLILFFHTGKHAYILPRLWNRGVCKIIGLKVETENLPPTSAKAAFYVGNHMSSFDIPTLASVIHGSFVTKEDIRSWPLFGFLAKLQQSAFISRSPEKTKQVMVNLTEKLKHGKNLIIFPEGSTTSGISVIPFKSSLFKLAIELADTGLQIQPFTIMLQKANGQSVDDPKVRDIYSWYGDQIFVPHFWNFLKNKGADVKLIFHPVIDITPEDDRKTLAQKAYDLVAKPLEQSLPPV